MSINKKKLTMEEHEIWFQSSLNNPKMRSQLDQKGAKIIQITYAIDFD